MADETPTIREYFDEIAFKRDWDNEERENALFDFITSMIDARTDTHVSEEAFMEFLDSHGQPTVEA